MRHPVQWIGRVQSRDVDQVGNDRTGCGFRAGAFAVIERGAHRIALHHHGIHSAFYVGNEALCRHQAWVNAQLNACFGALGDTQQLDAIAQLLGVFNVGGSQLGNAFDVGLVKLNRYAKSQSTHEGDFVCRVHTFNVEGGVGLGITQSLSLLEDHIKVQTFFTHFGQNEIGGAIDDASDPLNSVGG